MSIHPPSSDSVYDTENILLDFHTSFYCILFYFLTLETKFTITQDPFEYFIFYQQIVFERAIFIRLKEIITVDGLKVFGIKIPSLVLSKIGFFTEIRVT